MIMPYTDGTRRHRSRGRSHSKSARRSRSQTRSMSPAKTSRSTFKDDSLFEIGILGSGILHSSEQKRGTTEKFTYYSDSCDQEQCPKQFISVVKETFRNDINVYRKFVEILSQISCEETDKLELVKQVIILFDGHPDLILGFNTFLPSGYFIEIQNDVVAVKVFGSPDNQQQTNTGHCRYYNPNSLQTILNASALRKNDAMTYIQQVKKMYADDPYTYKKFREILKEYHSNKIDELETIQNIISLFHKYSYLIEGFSAFLPQGYHIYLHDQSYDIEYPGDHEGEVTIVNYKKQYHT